MSELREVQVTFDCADPRALSLWWEPAISDADGRGPRLFFPKVPEPSWTENRLHLDVRAAPGTDSEGNGFCLD